MLSISPSDVFTWIGSQPCFSRLQPPLASESFVPRRKWLALTRHPNLQVDSLYLKNGTVKVRVNENSNEPPRLWPDNLTQI